MTILTGLAWEPRARLYEPVAEVEGPLDWTRPLEGRWIRFWPWPYGLSGGGSALDVAAAASPLGQAAMRRAAQEDTRLLYVGVTRARDYRSEEHTSELQSLMRISYAVFWLKKKRIIYRHNTDTHTT